MSKSSIRINKSELLCKQGCGFYGNHQWDGFCSKCWREVKTKEDNPKLRFPKPNVNLFGLSDTLNEKRKHASNVRASAVSTLFGKKQTNKQPSRQTSRESIQVGKEFVQFLKSLNELEVTQDISNQVKTITEKLSLMCDNNVFIDEISEAAINFYQEMSHSMQTKLFYQNLSSEKCAELLDFIERYITTRLHGKLFSPSNSDDEEKDLLLQSRIRSLHWISVHILDADIDEMQEGVSDEVEAAITAIIEVNSKRSPLEKLSQIVKCSNHILSALRITKQGLASADDFLPALIYIVLKANPPLFESNIRFITRFANPNRLMSGEPGYYFTNMCCAVSFIRDLNSASLSMPQSEFDGCMNGESIPYDPRISLQRQRECVALIQSNMRMLVDIKSSQEALMSQAMQLQQDVVDFCASFNQQVQIIYRENPLKVHERKRKVDLDADTEDSILLPPPIQPQVIHSSSAHLNQFSLPRSTSRVLDILANPIVCTNLVDFNKPDGKTEDLDKPKLPSLDSISKLSLSLDESSALIKPPNLQLLDPTNIQSTDEILTSKSNQLPTSDIAVQESKGFINPEVILKSSNSCGYEVEDTNNAVSIENFVLDLGTSSDVASNLEGLSANLSQQDDDPFMLLTQQYVDNSPSQATVVDPQ